MMIHCSLVIESCMTSGNRPFSPLKHAANVPAVQNIDSVYKWAVRWQLAPKIHNNVHDAEAPGIWNKHHACIYHRAWEGLRCHGSRGRVHGGTATMHVIPSTPEHSVPALCH